MKLAILETGRPPGNLAEQFGDYPMMVQKMLGFGFETETYDVQAGELPPSPDAITVLTRFNDARSTTPASASSCSLESR